MSSNISIIDHLLKDILIPRVARIRQNFERPVLSDVEAAVLDKLRSARVLESVRPGMRIAIGVGPWVNVPDYVAVTGEINQAILETFRSRNIVIPMPQREVRMLQARA